MVPSSQECVEKIREVTRQFQQMYSADNMEEQTNEPDALSYHVQQGWRGGDWAWLGDVSRDSGSGVWPEEWGIAWEFDHLVEQILV